MKVNGWIDAIKNPPLEGGRYLCWVTEINDLGTSCFVWNCYYDDRENEWRDSHKKMNVTHWQNFPDAPKRK